MKRYKFIVAILLTLACQWLVAQNTENNPLSRYGLGELRLSDPVWMAGMGHGGVGFVSEQLYNPLNPASSSFLIQTDVELGLQVRRNQLDDRLGNQFSEWNGGIQNIQLGIPLQNTINDLLNRKTRKHFMGLQFGLRPYAGMGYNATILQDEDSTNIRKRDLQGDGALTAFNLGFSYRYKDLAVGLGMDYVFGNLNYNQNLIFSSISGNYDTYLSDRYHIGGWIPNIGILYRKLLNEDEIKKDNNVRRNFFSGGLSIQLPTNYQARYTGIHLVRYDESNPISGNVSDTILNVVDQESEGGFPFTVKAGFMYALQDRLGFHLQFQYDAWANSALSPGLIGNYANAFGIRAGGWFRKGQHHYDGFWKKSTFRYGWYYQEDYREIQNQQGNTLGLTLGWSYPIIFLRQDAMVHFSIEGGQRKTGTLLKENFIQFTFGVTINDNEWFLKRRYN